MSVFRYHLTRAINLNSSHWKGTRSRLSQKRKARHHSITSIRWSQDNKAQITINDFSLFSPVLGKFSAHLDKREDNLHSILHTHSKRFSSTYWKGSYWITVQRRVLAALIPIIITKQKNSKRKLIKKTLRHNMVHTQQFRDVTFELMRTRQNGFSS